MRRVHLVIRTSLEKAYRHKYTRVHNCKYSWCVHGMGIRSMNAETERLTRMKDKYVSCLQTKYNLQFLMHTNCVKILCLEYEQLDKELVHVAFFLLSI